MSELEDKLNKILSSPAEMEKIMGIARSLSGSLGSQNAPEGAAEGGAPVDLSALSTALGSIDPKTFRLISRLAGEYTSAGNDKSELLNAIKPYLKEDRRAKVDKAAELAKLARLARLAFSEFTGGDGGV